MKLTRILFILIALSAIGSAQQNYYVASHTASLSATTDKVTVQQPSTGARQVKFRGALVSCSTAATTPCALTLSQNGTAATANGFAIRFNVGTERIRLFDNNGNPLGTNINIAAVTGHPEAGQGGRGDGPEAPHFCGRNSRCRQPSR